MSIEIKVPGLPESVSDAVVAAWHVQEGGTIQRDANLVDLETDKVMLEVPAPASGTIKKLLVKAGDTVTSEQVIAILEEGEVSASAEPAKVETPAPASSNASAPQASAADHSSHSPAARKALNETGVNAANVEGSGKGGRLTGSDVYKAAASGMTARKEERVPMSRLRQRVAERLVEVQQSAAILTTFNEVNMKPVMDLRKKYKDQFEKAHDVRLGFMSFFVKASVEALKRFPAVNASIDGTDIVYHNYFDVGVAIGSPRGLVVPILRDADQMSMADIEAQILDYAKRAQTGKISIEEMTGGTFTISNGGTYGSMLSTPIINPPQSGILGMHNIVERAVVENGEIVARPMMYLALSYDHRIIDGKESIQFLVTIKELLEDPARMILGV